MKLTDQQLQELEQWGGCFFSLEEIALIMGLDLAALEAAYHDRHSAVHRAIMRGRLVSEGKLRQSVIDLAQSGSNPAQQLAMKMIEHLNLHERFAK